MRLIFRGDILGFRVADFRDPDRLFAIVRDLDIRPAALRVLDLGLAILRVPASIFVAERALGFLGVVLRVAVLRAAVFRIFDIRVVLRAAVLRLAAFIRGFRGVLLAAEEELLRRADVARRFRAGATSDGERPLLRGFAFECSESSDT